jgi:hypothetical protein
MRPCIKSLITVLITVSLLGASFLIIEVKSVLAQTDYTFGTENITEGYSVNPANKNAEDAAYNTLIESDQYTDTNFSGSSENVVTGTAGGGAFSSSLDTDDATRRSYTEANNNPDDSTVTLVPTSDSSVGFDTVYPADGVHYTKVDEGASHDSATTYIRAVTNADRDLFGLQDMSAPSGTPDLDVTIYFVMQDAGTGTAYGDAGIRIASTDYVGVNDIAAPNTWTSYNYMWETNPNTASEWTYTAINAMEIYVEFADAAPDVDVTTFYVVVGLDYSLNYVLDAQITYSSVGSTAQTISYDVICQGYRSGAENFGLYAWDYVALSWVSKTTVQAASDTDYNFNLATNERSSGASEVKFRVVGLTETSDTTQDVVYFDLLKVNRLEKGYALDVDLTASSVATYGNITLRIKGYTSAEQFNINVWNYTSAAYQTQKVIITSLSNTWQTTFNLHDVHHRSGASVKIQFTDNTAYTGDTTQDTLYVDVAWVTLYYTDPEISDFGADPSTVTEGDPIIFFMTYTDYDNQAPTYVRVCIGVTDYNMVANVSEDLTYHDGKTYYLSKSDLGVGIHEYYFRTIDVESGEVTTEPAEVTVNAPENAEPEFTSTPAATGHNNTLYYYDANADDADEDPLTFDLEGNITDFASINPTTGVVQGTPTEIGDYWLNVSVTDGIATVWQNTSVHIYTDDPTITSSAVDEWQHGTNYLYTAEATDPESEALTWHLEGNGTDIIDITPDGYNCDLTGLVPSMGYWELHLSVSDGVNTVWQNWTLTALNTAPTFTTEPILTGMVNVSYAYAPNATDINSDTLIYSIEASPDATKAWLTYNVSTGYLEGIPTINGSYAVNLSIADGLLTTYQNFTIEVDLNDADTVSLLALMIGLVFCFGLLFVGFKEKSIWLLAGPVWILCGITIFYDYGDLFLIAGVGLGLFLFIKGAYDVSK